MSNQILTFFPENSRDTKSQSPLARRSLPNTLRHRYKAVLPSNRATGELRRISVNHIPSITRHQQASVARETARDRQHDTPIEQHNRHTVRCIERLLVDLRLSDELANRRPRKHPNLPLGLPLRVQNRLQRQIALGQSRHL